MIVKDGNRARAGQQRGADGAQRMRRRAQSAQDAVTLCVCGPMVTRTAARAHILCGLLWTDVPVLSFFARFWRLFTLAFGPVGRLFLGFVVVGRGVSSV